jgi:hypothetical protein
MKLYGDESQFGTAVPLYLLALICFACLAHTRNPFCICPLHLRWEETLKAQQHLSDTDASVFSTSELFATCVRTFGLTSSRENFSRSSSSCILARTGDRTTIEVCSCAFNRASTYIKNQNRECRLRFAASFCCTCLLLSA